MINEMYVMQHEITSPNYGNTASGYSLLKSTIQTRNSGETVTVKDVLDDTEGIAAMDSLPLKEGTRNLDIGGGCFDGPTEHVLRWYRVTNLVYDPFGRSSEHNDKIIDEVKKSPVDSVTSNGVLNVILRETDRRAHINLARDSLKPGGVAFFKIWRGNNSNLAEGIQLNKDAKHFIAELQDSFGKDKVELIRDDIGNTIFAYKH